ncbi:MAG: phosphatidylserine decarboxylase [Desulfobacterales bacterium]|nr:MAG: phosphatidylserine decarboxylase [Desulfobacterales bacterium]
MIKLILTLLSPPALSRAFGRLTRVRKPKCLIRLVIKRFATVYHIDMSDYIGIPDDYPSLLEFFVRPLDPNVRPLISDHTSFLSPADGVLAELQEIHTDVATQAKGWQYNVSTLTGVNECWEKGWWLAVIYLSPSNYHRYHYPMNSRLDSLTHLGNRLFPVNRAGITSIKSLFIRNERVTASFSVGDRRFHIVAVGATFVGSIKMSACPGPFRPGQRIPLHIPVEQNDEMGRFEMGSTLVVLLPKDMAQPAITQGETVKVGTPLFKLS